MAIIKLENIAATASITIQLIKDYSMYTSEIISSNGTIFQSTDSNTTLTLRVYKGIEDITDKITDIEWSRFYFNNDELIEDRHWGDDKKNKSKIVLYKDEVEEKSIIQASGYSEIEGHRELVTTARITIIKISDIYISDITPTNPSDKMMWMDTNQTPPSLKIWSDELGYWLSSGMDVPIVKNLIRNSNFWTNIDEYYDVVNSNNISDPVRVLYQNKQWTKLQSNNNGSNSGGIEQEIIYPINKNSNYIFSLIGHKESGGNYSNSGIRIIIKSINENNITTNLIDEEHNLNTSITTVSVPFTTNNETEKIIVQVLTKNRTRCLSYVTELSLYNSSVYYPWELCPDDVDKQMNTKLDNNRLSVFNTIMDNGNFKAIYESENQYYIRSEYITPAVAEKSALDALSNKVSALETQYNTLLTQHNALQEQHNTLQGQYNTLQGQYNTLQGQYIADIKRLEDRITALEKPSDNETPSENK